MNFNYYKLNFTMFQFFKGTKWKERTNGSKIPIKWGGTLTY